MSVVWLILKIIGIVLLCLLGLLLILLLIPVTLGIRYEEQKWLIRARYGPLTFKLFESGKEKEKKKEQPEEEAQPDEPTEKEKSGIDLRLIYRLIKPGFRVLRSVVKSLKIRDLHLVLVASGEEPDEIGIKAGRMWAALGNIMALAGNIWPDIEYKELTVIPDFTGEHENDEKFSCNVRACPIIMVTIGIVFFVRFLKIKRQEDKRHEDKNKDAIRAKKETAS